MLASSLSVRLSNVATAQVQLRAQSEPRAGGGSSSSSTFLPSALATTGVSATVGGKRTGDSALCAAYAMAKVPTCKAAIGTDTSMTIIACTIFLAHIHLFHHHTSNHGQTPDFVLTHVILVGVTCGSSKHGTATSQLPNQA